MSKKYIALFAAALTAAISSRAELKFIPYLSGEIYGGQSFFSGSDANGLNGSVTAVPAMKFSDNFVLLPILSAAYRQTRDVQELAGGGFLTQKQQSYNGTLKGVYSLNQSWKAKASAYYRKELIQETKDESWGDGLFDYDKLGGGVEIERLGGRWKSVRAGFDYYTTAFPNFSSLSQQEFGSEINNGKDVLDFNSLDVSGGADLALGEKSLVSAFLLASHRPFTDQKIVKLDGTYSTDTRTDLYLYLSAGWQRQLPGLSLFGGGLESRAGIDASVANLASDQNNYDAGRTTFNENYYDYTEYGGGPRLDFRYRDRWGLGLGYNYSSRAYADRPVQNADGTYASDAITTNVSTFRYSLSYQVMKNLSLVLQGAQQHSTSNMKYETVYRYNFSSSHYFAGLSFQL